MFADVFDSRRDGLAYPRFDGTYGAKRDPNADKIGQQLSGAAAAQVIALFVRTGDVEPRDVLHDAP